MENNNDNKVIDNMLHKAFNNIDETIIPVTFTEKLVRKFEMRTMKRRLLEDWLLKVVIICIVGGSFVGILLYTQNELINQLVIEYLPILLVIFTIVFVFFFDQVILKWLFFIKNTKGK